MCGYVCCSLPKGTGSRFWTCWSESRGQLLPGEGAVSHLHKGTSVFLQPRVSTNPDTCLTSEGGQRPERLINQPKATQWPLDPFGCENLAPGPESRVKRAALRLRQAGRQEGPWAAPPPPTPPPLLLRSGNRNEKIQASVWFTVRPHLGEVASERPLIQGSALLTVPPPAPPRLARSILESFFRQPRARPARLFSLGLVTPV